MNDTMRYCHLDPLFRSHPESHRLVTFRGIYANSERFILALSHDEVVHGKRSLLGKQWGDSAVSSPASGPCSATCGRSRGRSSSSWAASSANGRNGTTTPNSTGCCWTTRPIRRCWPGSGPSTDSTAPNRRCTRPTIEPEGFRWVEANDYARAVFAFLRMAPDSRPVLVLLNFTPVTWENYRVGVPQTGAWEVLASSDDPVYGGTGLGVTGVVEAAPGPPTGLRSVTELDLAPAFGSIHGPSAQSGRIRDGASST